MAKKDKNETPEQGLEPNERLPPPGLPSIEEMRRQLKERMTEGPGLPPPTASVGQTIKTSLIEQDIELDPPAVGPNRLSNIVQRAWSYLWGKSPDGMRALRCDKRGYLHNRPISMDNSTWDWVFNDVSNEGDIIFTFGGVRQYVRIYTQFQRFRVTFITPANLSVNMMVINPTGTDGTNYYGSWEGFCECKAVRISGLDSATAKNVIVVGLVVE